MGDSESGRPDHYRRRLSRYKVGRILQEFYVDRLDCYPVVLGIVQGIPGELRPDEIDQNFYHIDEQLAEVVCSQKVIWASWWPTAADGAAPAKPDPAAARKSFRAKQGLDSPTEVTAADVAAIGRALRRF